VRKAALFAVAVVLAARHGSAQTEVRVAGDKVELRATAAPLSEVLDRLARQTGMKVTYDGPPPRARLNLTLSGVTPAQAVVSVLEGQGLNYAMRMDPTATRVESLMLVAGTGSAPAPAPALAPRPDPGPRNIEREPEPPETEDEPPSEVQAPPPDERRPGRFPGFPGPPTGPAVPLQLPTPPPAPGPAAGPSPTPPTPQD
jgi:hypothetical protein